MIDDISTVLIRFFGLLSFLSYLRVAAEAVAEWKANTTVLRIQAWFQLPLACLSLVYLFTYTRDDLFVKIKDFSFNLPALNACFFLISGFLLSIYSCWIANGLANGCNALSGTFTASFDRWQYYPPSTCWRIDCTVPAREFVGSPRTPVLPHSCSGKASTRFHWSKLSFHGTSCNASTIRCQVC